VIFKKYFENSGFIAATLYLATAGPLNVYKKNAELAMALLGWWSKI